MPADKTPPPYEPCPCGSGKKYKFCCMKKERGEARSLPARQGDGGWEGVEAEEILSEAESAMERLNMAAAVAVLEEGHLTVQNYLDKYKHI
jgi:hypothetical protein